MLQICKDDKKNILGTQIKTICNQNNLIEYYFKKILGFSDSVSFVSGWSLIMANNGYQNKLVYPASHVLFPFSMLVMQFQKAMVIS